MLPVKGAGVVGGQTICHRAGIAKLLRRWGQTGFLKTDRLLTLPPVICGHLTGQMLFPWSLSLGDCSGDGTPVTSRCGEQWPQVAQLWSSNPAWN